MMTPYERYFAVAKAAGCPRSQVENFLRAGVILQARQLDASAWARRCDALGGPTELGYGGARGGGKSHWLLAQMAADDCQRYDGLKCLWLRKVGKSGKEGLRDLLPKILGGIPYRYNESTSTLLFPNGSRILCGHFQKESDIDAYLGLEYDIIGVEEATTLTASKYTSIKSCNRSSKPNWRPRMYATTNPGGVGHGYFKRRFIDGIDPDCHFIPATADDNSFVNPEYRKVLDGFTGWQLRAWRYGDWDIAAGQFFSTFRRDVHVVDPFPIPADWQVWGSMDYGYQHNQAMYVLAKDGDGTIYVVGEHVARQRQVEEHVTAYKSLLEQLTIPLARLRTIVAGTDVWSTRETGGTIADKYAALGLTLKPANTDRIQGAAEILARLGDTARSIKPRLFLFATCPRLIDCLPELQHDPHRAEDVLKVDADDAGHGGDDPYDGFRYGIMAAHSPAAAIFDYYKNKANPQKAT